MNCRTFKNRIVELLDTRPDPAAIDELRQHAEACPDCARELEGNRAVLDLLHPSSTIHATPHFKERVMEKIRNIQEDPQPARGKFRRRVAIAAAAAAMWFVAISVYNIYAVRHGRPAQDGFAVLARAAEVMKSIRTVHIKAMMRTPPRDNFASIDLESPMIPVEIWKEDAGTQRYRIEKAGRWLVMDGKTTMMVVRFENAQTPPLGFKVESTHTGMVGDWLKPLLNIDGLMDHEVQLAKQQGSSLLMSHETAPNGGKKVVLTIEAKAQGDYSQSDALKNKYIIDSDNTRVYTFDEQSGRLESIDVLVKTGKDDVKVFEIAAIEYDRPIDPSLLEAKAPANIIWDQSPDELPGIKSNAAMTPKDVARAFFQACADNDWNEARNYIGTEVDHPLTRSYLGGLKIISIGEPFKSGTYGGWFVPYEIQLKDGYRKKFRLAVRNDNPKKQWSVDGGF